MGHFGTGHWGGEHFGTGHWGQGVTTPPVVVPSAQAGRWLTRRPPIPVEFVRLVRDWLESK